MTVLYCQGSKTAGFYNMNSINWVRSFHSIFLFDCLFTHIFLLFECYFQTRDSALLYCVLCHTGYEHLFSMYHNVIFILLFIADHPTMMEIHCRPDHRYLQSLAPIPISNVGLYIAQQYLALWKIVVQWGPRNRHVVERSMYPENLTILKHLVTVRRVACLFSTNSPLNSADGNTKSCCVIVFNLFICIAVSYSTTALLTIQVHSNILYVCIIKQELYTK